MVKKKICYYCNQPINDGQGYNSWKEPNERKYSHSHGKCEMDYLKLKDYEAFKSCSSIILKDALKLKSFDEICKENQKDFFFITINYPLVKKDHPKHYDGIIAGKICKYNVDYFRKDLNVEPLQRDINRYIDDHEISSIGWKNYQICLYTRPRFFFKDGFNEFGRDCADYEMVGIISLEDRIHFNGYKFWKFKNRIPYFIGDYEPNTLPIQISGYHLINDQPDHRQFFPQELKIDYKIPLEKFCISCDNPIHKNDRFREELYDGYKIYWHSSCKWPDYGGDLLKYASTEKKIHLRRKYEENYSIFL